MTRPVSNKRISEWVEEIDGAARLANVDPRDAAADLVSELTTAQVRALAVRFLCDEVARRRRSETLSAERDAERSPWLAETPGGGLAAGRPIGVTDEMRQRWEAEDRQIQERAMREIRGHVERYVDARKVEWTAELLDSVIAMPDGSVVLWGDATIEQHQQRRDMFLRNALANTEGAARHEQAIRELTQAGAPTLREMVSVNG